MMRIKGKLPKKNPPKSGYYDYIGLAGGIMNPTWRTNGFNSRIPDDHFRKLINFPKRGEVIDAIKKDRFLVTPHKEVLEYIQRKSSDYDRWISGMQRLQKKFEDFYNKFNSS